MTHLGDELHHSGWNACSSCYNDASRSCNRLILPCLGSNRIYVVDTGTNQRAPQLDKVSNNPYHVQLKCFKETCCGGFYFCDKFAIGRTLTTPIENVST